MWAYFNHFVTPETATTTHYFWSVSRPFKLDDKAVDQGIEEAVRVAFIGEDAPIIESVQQMMDGKTFDQMRPVLLVADAGALRARRVLKQLISREQSEEQPVQAAVPAYSTANPSARAF